MSWAVSGLINHDFYNSNRKLSRVFAQKSSVFGTIITDMTENGADYNQTRPWSDG